LTVIGRVGEADAVGAIELVSAMSGKSADAAGTPSQVEVIRRRIASLAEVTGVDRRRIELLTEVEVNCGASVWFVSSETGRGHR